jgi:hypothetical protein
VASTFVTPDVWKLCPYPASVCVPCGTLPTPGADEAVATAATTATDASTGSITTLRNVI